ncbi:MAG TPA: hypothetical protein VKB59_11935 [Micromonosporaceae bacterium]|nr:hypothetical protein [Micromonosporaceae bacterium]
MRPTLRSVCGGADGATNDPVRDGLGSVVAFGTAGRASMAKKSRKKKARRKSAANHGKRPNS